jgi:hypothetical protein
MVPSAALEIFSAPVSTIRLRASSSCASVTTAAREVSIGPLSATRNLHRDVVDHIQDALHAMGRVLRRQLLEVAAHRARQGDHAIIDPPRAAGLLTLSINPSMPSG